MNYSNPNNTTLSDNLEGYITANEDECDSSQYLSVLSQDLTLEEINVTLTEENIEDSKETDSGSTEDINQPFIFSVDGTNEIYGVQVAQDEDGNFRKYQIQYSENMNGELVPLLETIQFLPLEYEEQLVSSEENCMRSEVSQSNYVIPNEEQINHGLKNDFNIKERTQQNSERDKAWNMSTPDAIPYQITLKDEPADSFDQSSILQKDEKTDTVKTQNSIKFASVDINSKEISEDTAMEDHENCMSVQHLEIEHCLDHEEVYEETIEDKHFEQLFLEENHAVDTDHLVGNDSISKNTEENDIYQILNNASTNSGDNDHNMHTILKETIDTHPKTNILKKSFQKSLLKDFVNSEQKVVYVQTSSEKENLTVVDIESFTKPNSRSILKCNQVPQVLKQSHFLDLDEKYSQRNSCIRTVPHTKETKPAQAYLRTKEAKQARQFMNFINSTTIPQVPERKGRLPRKQQIKPVNHPDEDIVVKEMIVSSNGFVEPISAEEKKYLPVTEYVELLDSGDEINSLCNNKKKRKNNKKDELIEIEISDSDECDERASIEPGNSENISKTKNELKKKRGRPPKSKSVFNDKKNTYLNSPPKISRIDSDVESVTSTLKVIKMGNDAVNLVESRREILKNSCVNELKENSAKNEEHKEDNTMNIQPCKSNKKLLQTSSKSRIPQNSGASSGEKGFEYKFECEKCKSKFINKFLLNRHNCSGKLGSTFFCDICQLKFSNNNNLNMHKRTHVREPILKPNLTKISQVKIVPKKEVLHNSLSSKSALSSSRSSVISKAPLKTPKQASLSAKNPIRNSIQLPKNSTLNVKNNTLVDVSGDTLLGDHKTQIEENINKPPFTEITPEKISHSNIFKCEKKCDKCSKQFDNNTAWFDHQVLNHGFKTPDKTIGEKRQKKIVKDVIEHKGIRAASTVAKSFSMLKNRVQKI